jgi:leader peptidase (prepilin peptidase)/N-methyltransferase
LIVSSASSAKTGVKALCSRHPLKATAFLPFGLFLVPAIWIGWLVEALLD